MRLVAEALQRRSGQRHSQEVLAVQYLVSFRLVVVAARLLEPQAMAMLEQPAGLAGPVELHLLEAALADRARLPVPVRQVLLLAAAAAAPS